MTLRVLFVDDEPAVLEGLAGRMYRHRKRWQATYADGGQAAVAALAQTSFDVVVTDLRMPVVDGVAVLSQAKTLQPGALRVVLSGHAESETLSQASMLAHRMLGKPCDFDALAAVLEGAETWSEGPTNPSPARAKISWIGALPSPPTTYVALCQLEARGRGGSVAEIVGRDPALATRVLQLANSALLGVSRRVSTIDQAVALLGVDLLKSLALSVRLAAGSNTSTLSPSQLEAEQQHALAAATIARSLANVACPSRRDEVASAALLHDIGRLVLALFGPGGNGDLVRADAGDDDPATLEAEIARYGIDHAAAGAHLLERWGLPPGITQIVAAHTQAGDRRGDIAITVVAAASALAAAPTATLPKSLCEALPAKALAIAGDLAGASKKGEALGG